MTIGRQRIRGKDYFPTIGMREHNDCHVRGGDPMGATGKGFTIQKEILVGLQGILLVRRQSRSVEAFYRGNHQVPIELGAGSCYCVYLIPGRVGI
jgi:hypothetical protein